MQTNPAVEQSKIMVRESV